MARKHRRFALLDVTYDGAPLPGATMDWWEDERGQTQWTARALMPFGTGQDEGELAGKTKDGRTLSGHVLVGSRQMGPSGPRQTLVEFHGSGDLHGLDDLPD
ncbi:MAG TPA: hypothetical protein VEO91_07485 [Candidatus Limnocylindria bacterium]|jgi:hypothetical protein|nr:hypothetical protein [Candidatus Limnocylindria bacterium]